MQLKDLATDQTPTPQRQMANARPQLSKSEIAKGKLIEKLSYSTVTAQLQHSYTAVIEQLLGSIDIDSPGHPSGLE
jgi:hypothetical protein